MRLASAQLHELFTATSTEPDTAGVSTLPFSSACNGGADVMSAPCTVPTAGVALAWLIKRIFTKNGISAAASVGVQFEPQKQLLPRLINFPKSSISTGRWTIPPGCQARPPEIRRITTSKKNNGLNAV